MRRITIALPLVVASPLACSLARADVRGEVSAGTGTESSAPGYVTANAQLALSFERPPSWNYTRGLVLPREPGDSAAIWLFTGADPDDHASVRGDASLASYGTGSAPAAAVIGSAHASARGLGWQLDGGVALQPVGDLRDAFWRSGREVVASSVGFAMPAAFTVGIGPDLVSFGAFQLEVTDRERSSPTAGPGGEDLAGTVSSIRWRGMHQVLDLFAVHFAAYDHVETATDTMYTGISAQNVGVDVAALTWQASEHLALRSYAGFDSVQPLEHYTTTVSPTGNYDTQSDGPYLLSPRYWLELTARDGARTVTAGGGSWARLDPTGNAADAGQLATCSFADRAWKLDVSGELDVGRLRRYLIGPLAPEGLAPVGTTRWMGRGQLAASMHLASGLDVAATAWLERSDRDDPRWLVPSGGALSTHAGADVTARWRFGVL